MYWRENIGTNKGGWLLFEYTPYQIPIVYKNKVVKVTDLAESAT